MFKKWLYRILGMSCKNCDYCVLKITQKETVRVTADKKVEILPWDGYLYCKKMEPHQPLVDFTACAAHCRYFCTLGGI